MSNTCASVINKNRLDVDKLKYPFGCNTSIDWRGDYVFVGTISYTLNGVLTHRTFSREDAQLALITESETNPNPNFYLFQYIGSNLQYPFLKVDVPGIDTPYITKSKGNGLLATNAIIASDTNRYDFEIVSVNKKTSQAERIILQGITQLDFLGEDIVDSIIAGELYRI